MSTYYPERPYPRPKQRRVWPTLLILLAAAVLGVLLIEWRTGGRLFGRRANLGPGESPRPVVARGELAEDEKATIDIYKENAPSVVNITNLAARRSPFTLDVQQVPRGSGSGFVWDDSGIIVTNAHVLQGADAVEVVLADKERSSYESRTWVTYPDKDLAVLYIDAPKEKLRPIVFGTSADLKVGQKTFAIGNPFGLDQTLTTGVISALNRQITSESGRPIRGVIQTTAAINPGNSGGPLLDSEGKLIGVNTAILSPSGTFAGIGFAIPVDEVNQVVPEMVVALNQLVKERRGPVEVTPPRLGVDLVSDALARQLGVDEGAMILNVSPNSPAAKAGLRPFRRDPQTGRRRPGDIILAIDGQRVRSTRDVFTFLEGRRFGETLTVTIQRGGEEMDVKVTLSPIR
jgi:S1-C subfamily serine protease